jgi:hypothetical protein
MHRPYAIGSTKDLNLAAVRPTTVQLNNCSFRVIKNIEEQPAAQVCTNRKSLYTLYKCYLVQCSDKGYTGSTVTWTP